METSNASSDRFIQLTETGQLPIFVHNVLNKYSPMIVRLDQGRLSVYRADVISRANEFIEGVAKDQSNSRREGVLRELMYDLLPAKYLFDDGGKLKNNLTGDNENHPSGELAETLQGLPAALAVGNPIFDANTTGMANPLASSEDATHRDSLLEVVKKDVGDKSSDGEFYAPRNKLARLSLTFNPNNLPFLYKELKEEDDFDLFIERIRSGHIPACLISDTETRRVLDYFEFRKKASQSKEKSGGPPPPLPAFGRIVQRYRAGEKLNNILDTLANEKPYSEDWIHNSSREFYTMVPVVSSDPDDIPEKSLDSQA